MNLLDLVRKVGESQKKESTVADPSIRKRVIPCLSPKPLRGVRFLA